MRAAHALAAALLMLGAIGPPAVAADRKAFARTIAEKLIAGKALSAKTHTTDFQGDSLGCITLTTWELRDLGYRGHAFFCEDAFTEEVLGAVLIGPAWFAASSAGTTLATDAMTSRSAGSRTRCVVSDSSYDLPAISFCIADLHLSSFVTQKASGDPARRV